MYGEHLELGAVRILGDCRHNFRVRLNKVTDLERAHLALHTHLPVVGGPKIYRRAAPSITYDIPRERPIGD
jgi:hypothetical protein